MVAVQNIDPAISGQVTLHEGEYTYVARGLPPSAPMQTPHPVLQRQINLTTVGLTVGGQGGRAATPPAGWHVGSLSEAASISLAVSIAAGAAAAIAVPVITSGPASPSAP